MEFRNAKYNSKAVSKNNFKETNRFSFWITLWWSPSLGRSANTHSTYFDTF